MTESTADEKIVTDEQREEAAHKWVETAYEKMGAYIGPKFMRRDAQVELSKAVASSLLRIEGKPFLMSEAPTGTGKTIGYLIGSLAARAVSPELAENPVVVATATKALQQQIMANDAPTLDACGLIGPRDVVLAKGRGNYICMRDAEEARGQVAQHMFEYDGENALPDALSELSPSDIEEAMDAFLRGEWDGDFDQFGGQAGTKLKSLGSDSDSCVRSRCAFKDNCSFFKAREKLTTAKVIVTNHDIVLIDAKKMSQDEEPTLPVGNLSIVLDEAHHLGDKVLDSSSSQVQIAPVQRVVAKKVAFPKLIPKDEELARFLANKRVKLNDFNSTDLEEAVADLGQFLAAIPMNPDVKELRFPSSAVPPELRTLAGRIDDAATPLFNVLKEILGAIKKLEPPKSKAVVDNRRDIRARAFELLRVLNSLLESADHYRTAERMARWLYRNGEAISLHAMPIEPGLYLERLLWKSHAVKSVVMVSATLRDLGTYAGLRDQYRIPGNTRELTLPYTFPYAESTLTVVGMRYSPKQAEREGFLREVEERMPHYINEKEGTLVLFPSWSLMRRVGPLLKRAFGESRVKMQGDQPVKYLLARHKKDVDDGAGSILMGVATMAEGMDLPGKYCEHVVITSLPFAVPVSPLEQELQEILGRDYFGRRSLPDAMRKLTQMVGRLLRKEEDRGRVTLFDNRLGNTSYGRKMLENLPPFTKVIEPTAAAAAAAR